MENKKLFIVRILMMIAGIIILGFSIAVLKLALLGNDPYTGMLFAIADVTPISYPLWQIIFGIIFFIVQLLLGRHLIGVGTIINAFTIGYIVDFSYRFILVPAFGQPEEFPIQLITLIIGMLICSVGISLYQKADLGVSPYDSLSLIADERLKKIPYFWCRIVCDGTCALVCFLLGGIVGIGTLLTAFGFGPLVSFFNKVLSDPILRAAGKKNGAAPA